MDTTQSLPEKVTEYKYWVSFSLEETASAAEFQEEREGIARAFDTLVEVIGKYGSKNFLEVTPHRIAMSLANIAQNTHQTAAEQELMNFVVLMHLCTGKSRNNAKNELPIYLNNIPNEDVKTQRLPEIKRIGKKVELDSKPIPQVLATEDYIKQIAKLGAFMEDQIVELEKLIKFFFDSYKDCKKSLWELSSFYQRLKQDNNQQLLIDPLLKPHRRTIIIEPTINFMRDSLREYLSICKLEGGTDYQWRGQARVRKPDINKVEEVEKIQEKLATRELGVYDFIIPFNKPGCTPKLFITCHYSSGEYSSLSSKDKGWEQIQASREYVLSFVPDALFVEFIDGAGFCSHYESHLKKLLSQPRTEFFQMSSMPLRLTRLLKQAGLLAPFHLETEVLCFRETQKERLESFCKHWGKSPVENLIKGGYYKIDKNGRLHMGEYRRQQIRRYILLHHMEEVIMENREMHYTNEVRNHYREILGEPFDKAGYDFMIAPHINFGKIFEPLERSTAIFSNLFLTIKMLIERCEFIEEEWSEPKVISEDLLWLRDKGMIKLFKLI